MALIQEEEKRDHKESFVCAHLHIIIHMRDGYTCITFVCSSLRMWWVNQVWKWGLFTPSFSQPHTCRTISQPQMQKAPVQNNSQWFFSPMGSIKNLYFLFPWAPNLQSEPFIKKLLSSSWILGKLWKSPDPKIRHSRLLWAPFQRSELFILLWWCKKASQIL